MEDLSATAEATFIAEIKPSAIEFPGITLKFSSLPKYPSS